MKKKLLVLIGVLLTIISTGCGNDNDGNNIRDEDLSYLQDRTWFFENQYSGLSKVTMSTPSPFIYNSFMVSKSKGLTVNET